MGFCSPSLRLPQRYLWCHGYCQLAHGEFLMIGMYTTYWTSLPSGSRSAYRPACFSNCGRLSGLYLTTA